MTEIPEDMEKSPAMERKSVLINQDPGPRILVRGFSGQDRLINRILSLGQVAKYIRSLREVRQAEWDVLITDGEITQASGGMYSQSVRAAEHLCIVYVGSTGAVFATIESDYIIASGLVSKEFHRFKDLPERVSRLVHEQLEPVLKARGSHTYFTIRPKAINMGGGRGSSVTVGPALPKLYAFSAAADGQVLAGKYSRGKRSEAWLIPGDVPDVVPWIQAALGEWHSLAPERFPGLPDWADEPAWQTADERKAVEELVQLTDEREKLISELELRESAMRAKLLEAKSAADAYERKLLTSQSAELVNAVKKALVDLGFLVKDSDATATADDFLEDLQLEDPDDPDWVALVEVKGYSKGAKTEALVQFLRFQGRFQAVHGRLPDALWYIANQFLQTDPGMRQKMLHGKDKDVEVFAAVGGVVVDTVDLFTLLMDVQDGRRSAPDVRSILRGTRGRLFIPEP